MSLSKQTDACTRDSRARIVMDTPSAPSFSLDTKSWHEDCRSTHSSVRPRRSHSSVPTAIQLRCRVERRSRMAAAWRPPEGLVLDGREHGGRLWRGGEEGDHRRLWLPASASRVPYSVWEVEAGSPSKTLLSAPSESVILLICHEASIQPVAQPNRSSATRAIDNSLGGSSLHW